MVRLIGRLQGLEEGHTRPCWPIQTPGLAAHRSARREENAEAAASKRWDLLGGCRSPPCHNFVLARPAQSLLLANSPVLGVSLGVLLLACRQCRDSTSGQVAGGAAGQPLPGELGAVDVPGRCVGPRSWPPHLVSPCCPAAMPQPSVPPIEWCILHTIMYVVQVSWCVHCRPPPGGAVD